jgi:RibD C-terminal domain
MASDVQLMGRITYEEFAQAWPAMEEAAGEFGAKMNAMPKVVVSTTLTDPTWKNTTVAFGGDLPSTVAALKDEHAGDILVSGSATLIESLRQHDLVDEYRLMVSGRSRPRQTAVQRRQHPSGSRAGRNPEGRARRPTPDLSTRESPSLIMRWTFQQVLITAVRVGVWHNSESLFREAT